MNSTGVQFKTFGSHGDLATLRFVRSERVQFSWLCRRTGALKASLATQSIPHFDAILLSGTGWPTNVTTVSLVILSKVVFLSPRQKPDYDAALFKTKVDMNMKIATWVGGVSAEKRGENNRVASWLQRGEVPVREVLPIPRFIARKLWKEAEFEWWLGWATLVLANHKSASRHREGEWGRFHKNRLNDVDRIAICRWR